MTAEGRWLEQGEHYEDVDAQRRVTEETIGKAIERWYSANYPTGVRLKGIERLLLARSIAQQLGVPLRPPDVDPATEHSDEHERGQG